MKKVGRARGSKQHTPQFSPAARRLCCPWGHTCTHALSPGAQELAPQPRARPSRPEMVDPLEAAAVSAGAADASAGVATDPPSPTSTGDRPPAAGGEVSSGGAWVHAQAQPVGRGSLAATAWHKQKNSAGVASPRSLDLFPHFRSSSPTQALVDTMADESDDEDAPVRRRMVSWRGG